LEHKRVPSSYISIGFNAGSLHEKKFIFILLLLAVAPVIALQGHRPASGNAISYSSGARLKTARTNDRKERKDQL
jgi:hypothetical protein